MGGDEQGLLLPSLNDPEPGPPAPQNPLIPGLDMELPLPWRRRIAFINNVELLSAGVNEC